MKRTVSRLQGQGGSQGRVVQVALELARGPSRQEGHFHDICRKVATGVTSAGSRYASSRSSGDLLGPGNELNQSRSHWLLFLPCSHLPVSLIVLTARWEQGREL